MSGRALGSCSERVGSGSIAGSVQRGGPSREMRGRAGAGTGEKESRAAPPEMRWTET